jgi:predicted 3-demethylubiquinone-9 3-methyltransferase (glyoxalase superfamily)
MKIKNITPHLWFDNQAEEAVKFYTSVFENSSVGRTSYYTEAGKEIHKMKPGSVMTIEFTLNGMKFVALNGGPVFKFNEAVSFMVTCETQKELDFYWDKLSEGGDSNVQQCGWLKDKFGLSWQVVPEILPQLITDRDTDKVTRVMDVFMKMKKIDIQQLQDAAEGRAPVAG